MVAMDARDWFQFSGTAQSGKYLGDLCLPEGRRGMSPDRSCGPLILILHQYSAIGRWWALTSVVQRQKYLLYVVCVSQLLTLPGIIQDTVLVEHRLGVASNATQKWSFERVGEQTAKQFGEKPSDSSWFDCSLP